MKTLKQIKEEVAKEYDFDSYLEMIDYEDGFDICIIDEIAKRHANEQLILHGFTFCLPIEGDTFVSWHNRHFKLQIDSSVVAIKNETIKYTQDQMLELWNFLTDRLLAN